MRNGGLRRRRAALLAVGNKEFILRKLGMSGGRDAEPAALDPDAELRRASAAAEAARAALEEAVSSVSSNDMRRRVLRSFTPQMPSGSLIVPALALLIMLTQFLKEVCRWLPGPDLGTT